MYTKSYSSNPNIISKCKDCTDRYPACHDSCEYYKDYKTKLEDFKEKKDKIKKKNAELYTQKRDSIERERRKRKR